MLISKKTAEKRGTSIYDGAGSAVSAFARRQMEKMGWTEGKGLGKREDGLSSHIKVAKKDDSAGIGVDALTKEQVQVADNWWHDGFSKQLKAFGGGVLDGKKVKKVKKKKTAEGSGSSSSGAAPSYEELFAATGGARLGMRARAKQTGKIARAELGLAAALPVGDDTAVAGEGAAAGSTGKDGKQRKDGKKKQKDKGSAAAGEAEVGSEADTDKVAGRADKEAKRRDKKEKRKEKRKGEGMVEVDEEEGARKKKKRRKSD